LEMRTLKMINVSFIIETRELRVLPDPTSVGSGLGNGSGLKNT
jgi:hypothetical protein